MALAFKLGTAQWAVLSVSLFRNGRGRKKKRVFKPTLNEGWCKMEVCNIVTKFARQFENGNLVNIPIFRHKYGFSKIVSTLVKNK